MILHFSFKRTITAITLLLSITSICAHSQTSASKTYTSAEIETLRANVEAHPNDMEKHKAYLAAFRTPDDVKDQYEEWMKKYPKSSAVPFALAQRYGHYSPLMEYYLMKAEEIDPLNQAIWQEISQDAGTRGNKAKAQEYTSKIILAKAIASLPQDTALQFDYVNLLRQNNHDLWKEKTLELVAKYYTSPEAYEALTSIGYSLEDKEEKIAVWEQLKNMDRVLLKEMDPFVLMVNQVTMTRLADLYIQTGQYTKAKNLSMTMLAEKAPARLNFEKKIQLATQLEEAEKKIRDGKLSEAKEIILPLESYSKNLFDFEDRIILLKGSILDKTGSTKSAYDSLLAFQAKTPMRTVKKALEAYGGKLNKSQAQIATELKALLVKNSKPATPFDLEQYGINNKVNLEELKGKVVLISFWYPNCGPCRAEMPHIEKAIKQIDKEKLAYLGINGLRGQDGFVLPIMNSEKYSFTALGADEKVTNDYGVFAYPSNFLVDQDGRIVYSGFMLHADSYDMLTLMIENLLI